MIFDGELQIKIIRHCEEYLLYHQQIIQINYSSLEIIYLDIILLFHGSSQTSLSLLGQTINFGEKHCRRWQKVNLRAYENTNGSVNYLS